MDVYVKHDHDFDLGREFNFPDSCYELTLIFNPVNDDLKVLNLIFFRFNDLP